MDSALPKLAIGHDYLLQYGGAERVVETWSREWPEATISTLAHKNGSTFETFSSRRVRPLVRNAIFEKNIEIFLPVLPSLSKQVRLEETADIALISTSGFAHHFLFNGPKLFYFHSPARWLYSATQYRKSLPLSRRFGLSIISPYLRSSDRFSVNKYDRVVANSVVSRDRIWGAYGIDAVVVNPPVQELTAPYVELPVTVPENFLLAVARNRGYKNLELADEAARLAGIPLVVAGSGTESIGITPTAIGLGRVSEGQLRSLYRRSMAILLTGDEDYGLTGPEANFEGTPSIGVPKGGYLETIVHGVNGLLAECDEAGSVARQINNLHSLDRAVVAEHARKKFVPENHLAELASILGSMHEN